MSAFKWPEVVVILSDNPTVVAGTHPERYDSAGVDTVNWQENHVRYFFVDRVEADEPDRFRFVSTRGQWYELRPMSLELYEKHVRLNTIGRRSYKTLADLNAAMLAEW
jgi:hypothetical protein